MAIPFGASLEGMGETVIPEAEVTVEPAAMVAAAPQAKAVMVVMVGMQTSFS